MKTLLAICLLISGCSLTKRPTPTEENHRFIQFCSERVVDLKDLNDLKFNYKNDYEWGEMMYQLGLFHGCHHGIMDWHWFRDKPPALPGGDE